MKTLDDRYLAILLCVEKAPNTFTYDNILLHERKDDFLYLLEELKYLQRLYVEPCYTWINLSPEGINFLANWRAEVKAEVKVDKRWKDTRRIAIISICVSVAAVIVAILT